MYISLNYSAVDGLLLCAVLSCVDGQVLNVEPIGVQRISAGQVKYWISAWWVKSMILSLNSLFEVNDISLHLEILLN